MKITKTLLKKIIKEELESVLRERITAHSEKEYDDSIRTVDFSDEPAKIVVPMKRGANMKTALLQAKLNLALKGAKKEGKKVTRDEIAVDGISGRQTRQAIKDVNLAADVGNSSKVSPATDNAIFMFASKIHPNPRKYAAKTVVDKFGGEAEKMVAKAFPSDPEDKAMAAPAAPTRPEEDAVDAALKQMKAAMSGKMSGEVVPIKP